MSRTILGATTEGLRRELKELRRLVMDLKRTTGDMGGTEPSGGTEVEAGGGGVPTLFVAASDASDRSKSYADYVCDGANDEVEINAALVALGGWGGRVLLSEGMFTTDGLIEVFGSGRLLEGLGAATYIYAAVDSNDAVSMSNEAMVRNLWLDGASVAGRCGIDQGGNGTVVSNVVISGFDEAIITGGTGARVLHCRFPSGGLGPGIDARGSGQLVQGCTFDRDLIVDGADRGLFLDCHYTSTANIDVLAGATRNAFGHNYLPGGASQFSDAGTGTNLGTNFSDAGSW